MHDVNIMFGTASVFYSLIFTILIRKPNNLHIFEGVKDVVVISVDTFSKGLNVDWVLLVFLADLTLIVNGSNDFAILADWRI